MTVFHLVRHGAHDLLDRILTGRMPGVGLNDVGRRDSVVVGKALADTDIAAVVTSPLERARETADIIAQRCEVPLAIDHDLQEIDFGAWTGLRFQDLATRADWQAFNHHRATAKIPGGESLRAVQTRMIDVLHRLRARHGRASIVVVGHGDPIKLVVLSILGAPVDATLRLEIAPGSISTVELDSTDRVLAVNRRPASD